jgi:hypothetical protein
VNGPGYRERELAAQNFGGETGVPFTRSLGRRSSRSSD